MNRRGFIKGLLALPLVGPVLASTEWGQRQQALHNLLLQRLESAETTIKARLDTTVEDIFSTGTQEGVEGGLGDLLK